MDDTKTDAAVRERPASGSATAPYIDERYVIREEIGRGGMGQVFVAQDRKLGRDVAIKVLHRGDANEQALRRFEQEARAAGALNHPNIIAVHDAGTYQGAPYIVEELLQGTSLRDRLGNKPLPLSTALDYAAQLARGLAAAHEKGVIHRDLKPENLFVTSEGQLKILDFGIAKLAGAAVKEEPPRLTDTGAIMGTVSYMSPEQLRGERVDHRSDIFSAGAILFEMLSGTRAFRRATEAETISATLNDEPPDLPARVPLAIDRLVRRCLEKRLEARYQSAKDFALGLESAAALSAVPAHASRPRLLALAVLAAVLLASGAVFVAGRRAGRAPVPRFQQLTFRRGVVDAARFTPDGLGIIYSAAFEGGEPQVYSARLRAPDAAPLGLNGGLLSVSRAEQMLVLVGTHHTGGAYFDVGTAARVGLSGGATRELLEGVVAADWKPDGSDFAVARLVAGMLRIEFPAGKVLYQTDGEISQVRFSPAGDRIAFLDHPLRGSSAGGVAVVDLDGRKRPLTADFAGILGLVWSPKGDELWFTANGADGVALRAVDLEGRERIVLQIPDVPVILDLDRDGRALLDHHSSLMKIMARPPNGEKEHELSWFNYSSLADLTDDGQTVLFTEETLSTLPIFTRRTDGTLPVQVGYGSASSFSPDGKQVVSISDSGAAGPRMVLLPTGAGESVTIPIGGVTPISGRLSADGKRIVLVGREPGRGQRLYVVSAAGGKPKPISPEGVYLQFAARPADLLAAAHTADGRVALYSENESPRELPELAGTLPDSFSADGRTLYAHQAAPPCIIYRLDLVTRRKEIWKRLEPPDPAGLAACGLVKVTPDGRAYAYRYRRELSTLYLVEGLR